MLAGRKHDYITLKTLFCRCLSFTLFLLYFSSKYYDSTNEQAWEKVVVEKLSQPLNEINLSSNLARGYGIFNSHGTGTVIAFTVVFEGFSLLLIESWTGSQSLLSSEILLCF